MNTILNIILKVNPCCNNPCGNGGSCVAVGTSYTCTCPTCYSGSNCQTCKNIHLNLILIIQILILYWIQTIHAAIINANLDLHVYLKEITTLVLALHVIQDNSVKLVSLLNNLNIAQSLFIWVTFKWILVAIILASTAPLVNLLSILIFAYVLNITLDQTARPVIIF